MRRRRYTRPPWPSSTMLVIAGGLSALMWFGLAAGFILIKMLLT
jgi:hypothetical protein